MKFSPLTLFAKEAALKAGQLLEEGFRSSSPSSPSYRIYAKEGNQNLVTDYDLASQKLIIGMIKKEFPSHFYLAEEEGLDQLASAQKDDAIIWVIDPLDGTVNYAHNIPFFAVSIAAVQRGKTLCGAIYNPILKELFLAERGVGSYLHEAPLEVSSSSSFDQGLMATGFPYDAYENPEHCLERFCSMVRSKASIRRFGAASLDIAYVAMGRLDLFWEQGLKPWDVAAAQLLLEEAGGCLTLYDGQVPSFPHYPSVLATNGKLHSQALSIFRKESSC